mmetsp:Transcript_15449/g.42494  ORF Transcript_15449/g.42494 Transcript_15449/m.42494 type:complete len:226 (-) Transcript_15449:211-888(-)
MPSAAPSWDRRTSKRWPPRSENTRVVGAERLSRASSQSCRSSNGDTSSSSAQKRSTGTESVSHAPGTTELGATRTMASTRSPTAVSAASCTTDGPAQALPMRRHRSKPTSSNAASMMASKSESWIAELICTFGMATDTPTRSHPAVLTTRSHSPTEESVGGKPSRQTTTPVVTCCSESERFPIGSTTTHSTGPSNADFVARSTIRPPTDSSSSCMVRSRYEWAVA